ncbi:hypothetical protein [Marininema halotolerans]|uniref:Uncharacterized protein n=1 Tax=Marininema halotolerans TaxID=1155944 RepID=A0A1I6RN06_9BACL|nr:hypothetical protein [Marininema halotolerans]SFS66036.1 hypothetical protein SAMN05444972_105221 [Marininema halotolerans]
MLRKKRKQEWNSGSLLLGMAVGTLATGAAVLLNSEARTKVKNTSKDLYWKVNHLRNSRQNPSSDSSERMAGEDKQKYLEITAEPSESSEEEPLGAITNKDDSK